ncbi:MAG: 1,4-alpha-glucan branching protein domain-containing protein [Candidatus Zipacnadales bacterium]
MSYPGAFCLVLHTHLPYVLGHSTWPHGSRMLYDAAANCYLPLLRIFRHLTDDGILPRVTISLTPVVLEQLADSRFREWFPSYLQERGEWAMRDQTDFKTRGDEYLADLARVWAAHFWELKRFFDVDLGGDISGAFRELQERGAVELMSSAATHGYFPLLHEECSIQAQVRQGARTYERLIGRRPHGFWLPECAYRPRAVWAPPGEIIPPTGYTWLRKGVHEFLAENGFDYFVVDTHMLSGGDPLAVDIDYDNNLGKLWGRIRRRDEPPRPSWEKTPYFPYFVGELFENYPPVACLVRHPEVSHQVWSAEHGYPGDGWYLEFHKKHIPGDHRYWRVTDDQNDLATKQPYVPEMAAQRLRENAGHFVSLIPDLLESQPRPFGRRPLICAPFDAELFGHWWYEGPAWLEQVIRWTHEDPQVEFMTCHEYLDGNPPATAITLPEGSWGAGGGHFVWLNPQTVWTWQRIYDAEQDMRELAREHGSTKDPQLRAFLQQAARELLLLQASDWQFLITTNGAPDYAAQRLDGHHSDFKRVAELARRWARGDILSEADWAFYGDLCQRDAIFPDIEPQWFAKLDHPAE